MNDDVKKQLKEAGLTDEQIQELDQSSMTDPELAESIRIGTSASNLAPSVMEAAAKIAEGDAELAWVTLGTAFAWAAALMKVSDEVFEDVLRSLRVQRLRMSEVADKLANELLKEEGGG